MPCLKGVPSTIALILTSAPGWAHHSFSMFDLQRQISLTGTVREFQFNNPHCFIQLVVETDGRPEEWSIEMGAPAHLIRQGWKHSTLRPGDKISITINPLRNGGKGGNYVAASSEGRALGVAP